MAMEDLSSMWLPELEMEDQQFMNRYDTIDNVSADSFSSESYILNECFIDKSFEEQAEMKLQGSKKSSNINRRSQTPKNFVASTLSSNTFTISFGDLKPKDEIRLFDEAVGNGKLQNMARTEVQAQDHVSAERKRRERLNRYFISMSSLLPNLKKMDKASVLEEATNYIRELQDRVKELEGLSGVTRKGARELIIALKRSMLSDNNDDNSSSCETNSGDGRVVPCKSSAEIEVRMSGSSVLCRIQSQKDSSLLMKALSKIQKFGLSVISSNTMPFADTTTLVTIVAQIEDDFFLTPTDIVRDLQLVL